MMNKTISIVLTTGLLLGTISFSALARDREAGPAMVGCEGRTGRHGQRFNSLNLTADQQKKLLTIRQEFQTATQSLRFEKQQLQLELRQLWAAKPLNQKEIEAKSKAVAGLQVQLRAKAQTMQEKLQAVLTPEQLKKFNEAKPRPSQMRKVGKRQGKRGNFAKNLNLTLDQEKQLLKLSQEFQKDTLALRQELAQHQLELRQLWVAKPLDQKKIEAQTQQVTALKVKLAAKSDQHREALRKVLTEAQLTKLKEQPQPGFKHGRGGCFKR